VEDGVGGGAGQPESIDMVGRSLDDDVQCGYRASFRGEVLSEAGQRSGAISRRRSSGSVAAGKAGTGVMALISVPNIVFERRLDPYIQPTSSLHRTYPSTRVLHAVCLGLSRRHIP
jgi:hypothetical protein